MNIAFWLIVTALLLLALLIILPPIWKNRVMRDADAEQRNVGIARDRVKDLKQQLQAGALSEQQYEAQYHDLEMSLADDLDSGQNEESNWTHSRWIIPVIVICLPLFSLLLYYQLGEPEALVKAQQATQVAQQQPVDVQAMVDGLAQRLKENPDNPQGWLMLGRSYKHLQEYALAAHAFEKAYVLLGDQAEVMLHYADALAMANGGRISGKAAELVFKALEQQPNHVMGLWLGGMALAQAGEAQQALQMLHKLENLLPPDSDSYQQLQRLLTVVKAQADGTLVAQTNNAAPSTAVSVRVQVSVSPEIAAKVAEDTTVFIYAKAQTGPPMPLAIVKKQVAELPLSITLDDSMAMVPAMKLSGFERVTVVARISTSGQAMPQKGDYIGKVDINQLAPNSEAEIVIDSVL